MTTERDPSDDTRLTTILEQIGPEFVEDGAKRIGQEEVEAVAANLDEVVSHFRTGDALGRYRADGELLASLLRDYASGAYRVIPYWPIAVATFTLHYVLKPIDIIPDSLPTIGQLDDARVVGACLEMIGPQLHGYKVWKMANELMEPGHAE